MTDALSKLRSCGASLLFAVVSVNTSSTLDPCGSVAVTRTSSDPTSPFSGVPEKVRVEASNDSHPGSADPSASVAV